MTELIFPPPLMTSDPGSYARATILERKPQIIHQVTAENSYPREIEAALQDFEAEITGRQIQPILEKTEDTSFWNSALQTYSGCSWLEVPWYFAETYFYRRLLEAVHYFQPGPWQGQDPFRLQKHRQIETDLEWFTKIWDNFSTEEPLPAFETLLHSCLWGNRGDLSNFDIQVKALGGQATSAERSFVLIDDSQRALDFITKGLAQVDIVTDNVGKELLFDLALAGFLIDQGWVKQTVFCLKKHPFFVSDARITDLQFTIKGLQASPSLSGRSLGNHLENLISSGKMVLTDDFFWTSCLMYRQLPQSLWEELSSSDLVLLKGDVNYRRILDDLHWPPETRMEDVARYFPTSFLTLRTLKAEIMIGLGAGQAETLESEDPNWLIDGKRGLIQFIKK
jgi:uncharacterized protein with ATP-grasp and redox domains